MNIIQYLLNNIIFVILEGATLLFLFLYLIRRFDFLKSNWFKSLLYIILYMALSSIVSSYRGLPLSLFYIIFNILILAHLTNTNLYLSVVANIIVFLIYGIAETVVSIPILYFMGVPYNEAMNNQLLQAKALLIIRPVQTAVIYLITRFQFNKKLLSKQFFPKGHPNTAYLLLILFFMSVFYSNMTKYINDVGVLLVSMLLFLSVVLIGVLDTKERIKLMNIENKLKLQQEYSRNMELIVDAVRKEKHDYKNHISTLVALCTMQGPDVISKIRFYALKLIDSNNTSGFRFYNTGNKYLDGLLAIKNDTAVNNDIYFEVDVEMTMENILVDDVDLTTIVGNIVDNAFDAVLANPPHKKKIVSLSVYQEGGKYCISVSNNGNEITDAHKNHIFEYKYSTKDETVGERGYGLFIVKELTVKNHGEITFNSNEFETEFLISFLCKTEVPKPAVGSL